MEEYLLTFEWNKDNEILEIHGNKEGLLYLRDQIGALLSNDKDEHVHLFTPKLGGYMLTEEPQSEAGEILDDVEIFYWKG